MLSDTFEINSDDLSQIADNTLQKNTEHDEVMPDQLIENTAKSNDIILLNYF